MAKVTGTVYRIYDKQWKDKTFYSIKLDGDKNYYGMGTSRAVGVAEPGHNVEFQVENDKKGYPAVVEGTIKLLSKTAPPAASGVASAASGTSRDNSIQYQSSRKDALALLGVVVSSGALKLPAKDAAKLEVLTGFVDTFTATFFEDINTLGAIARANAEDEPSPEPAKETAEGDDD